MTRTHVFATWALAALLPFSPGCGAGHEHDHDDHDGHEHAEHDHGDGAHDHGEGHVHVAPHGGTLVAIAEEFFNAELLLNAESGELHVYLLDSHAENPVRVSQESLDLTVAVGEASHTLSLAAQADGLTGEEPGDSSHFMLQAPQLVGATAFEGSFGRIEGRGEVFESTAFAFPSGATDHDHAGHDHDGEDHDGEDHDGEDHADHDHADHDQDGEEHDDHDHSDHEGHDHGE